ncbi:MAG: type II toxin-antitoxin system VapC family toxin [Chloroflexi bacterium]|nr:type II toxin-antitoxin system VapC family toxin [Chloroflexota bacterium]
MTRYVIDASVAVEYLLRTPLGVSVAGMIESASLVAPELMDAEVLSVLRRAVLNGRLEESRARMVVEDLAHWPVDRIAHRALAPLAWRYHRNVSAYDAFYVAAARAHDLPLLTADGRLTRASGLGVVVQHVHIG